MYKDSSRALLSERYGNMIIGNYEVNFDVRKKTDDRTWYVWAYNRNTGKEGWVRYSQIRRAEKYAAIEESDNELNYPHPAYVTVGKRKMLIGRYETVDEAQEAEERAKEALYG
ncbi:hypothetical protein [Jeotgalibacillus aurantiacus]|uniref:hypothetical protein n=1 Tax=Jeotgalibacillus aurantiacus TaxID=2763266 RepID=UPI001D0B96AB|nr:hypothetical protein [Jeotgalibacillus aurantiacus]